MLPKLTGMELSHIRHLMGFKTRRMLAEVLSISTRTLESWEQEVRPIPGWLRVALWGAGITSRFGEGYGTGKKFPVTDLPSILGLTEDTISEAIFVGNLSVHSIRGVLVVDYDALLNFYIFFLLSDEGRIQMAIDRLTLINAVDAAADFSFDTEYNILISLGCSIRGIIGPFPPERAKIVKSKIKNNLRGGILLLQRIAPELLFGFKIEVQEQIIEEATKKMALLLSRQMLVVLSEESEPEEEQEHIIQSILLKIDKIDVGTVFRTLQRRFSSPGKDLFKWLNALAHPTPGAIDHFPDLSDLRDLKKILHYNILQAIADEIPAPISLESLRRVEELASQRLSGHLAECVWKSLEKKKS